MGHRSGLALTLVAVAAISACDDGDVATPSPDGGAAAGHARAARTPTVGCSAAIRDRVDPEWRRRSIVRGRFGLYGNDADIRTADRWDGSAFWTKIPVIVDGHRAVTLRIALRDRERAGLTYGPGAASPGTSDDGARGLARAPRRVRFVPCGDRATSAWPGGIVLSDRRRVHLRVRAGGSGWSSLSIGRRS